MYAQQTIRIHANVSTISGILLLLLLRVMLVSSMPLYAFAWVYVKRNIRCVRSSKPPKKGIEHPTVLDILNLLFQ